VNINKTNNARVKQHNTYVNLVAEKSIYGLLWLAEKKLRYVLLRLADKRAENFLKPVVNQKNTA